jgi:hypothetical protein
MVAQVYAIDLHNNFHGTPIEKQGRESGNLRNGPNNSYVARCCPANERRL